jgi:hypothetical protein
MNIQLNEQQVRLLLNTLTLEQINEIIRDSGFEDCDMKTAKFFKWSDTGNAIYLCTAEGADGEDESHLIHVWWKPDRTRYEMEWNFMPGVPVQPGGVLC